MSCVCDEAAGDYCEEGYKCRVGRFSNMADDGRAVPNGKISCRLRTAGGNPGGFCCDDIAGSVAAPPIYGGDKR